MFFLSALSPNAYSIPVLLAGTAVLALGIGIWRKNRSTPVGTAFLLMTLAVATWLLSYAVIYSLADPDAALFWVRVIANIGVTSIAPFVLLLALHAVGAWRRLQGLFWASAVLAGIFLIGAMTTEWFVTEARRYFWGFYGVYGPLGYAFIVYFATVSGLALGLLWREHRHGPSRRSRSRAGMLLTALSIGYLASVDFLPSLGVPVYAFGFGPILAFVAITAWGVMRHRIINVTTALAAEEIVQTMNDGLAVADAEGLVRVFNAAMADLSGLPPERALGTPINQLFPGLGLLDEPSGWLLPNGPMRDNEWLFAHPDGSSRTASVSASLMMDASGEAVAIICVAVDITQRKQAEESLRATTQRLEQALRDLERAQEQLLQEERLKTLGLMASGIAHDFGGLLTPIKGYAELLQIRAANGDLDKAELEEGLRAIDIASRDAMSLVERLRHLYKPTEKDAPLEPVDVNELVHETVEMTRAMWLHQPRQRGVTVSVQTVLTPVPSIPARPSDLREILINLLSNALDAMPEGGGITIRTEARDGQVRLEFRDTGVGMPDEVRRRCLEPFFSTKGALGSGLGLAMVATLVARYNGVMDIESAPGSGTAFLLDFPVRVRSDNAWNGAETPGL